VSTAGRSTQGYALEAPDLLKIYESIPFAKTYPATSRLLPAPPRRLLDIGAGTGRDAAGFAALGYNVVATEPVAEMRRGAMALHPDPRIEWLDDSLPHLARLSRRGDRFDIVMMTAVWMHLDPRERQCGMARVSRLLGPHGLLMLTLRYGSVPPGRRMFEVSMRETIALARAHGLVLVLRREAPSLLIRAQPVTWQRLAFRKG
jgi:SAM-dependent methyltransferase